MKLRYINLWIYAEQYHARQCIGWGWFRAISVLSVLSLLLGCVINPYNAPHDSKKSPVPIFEISKHQIGFGSHPYVLTLSNERMVNYTGAFLGRLMKKTVRLS